MKPDGYLKDASDRVVATVHGYSGTPPTGQTFVAATNPAVATPGAAAPADYVGNIAATDHLMARAAEDLIVLLLAQADVTKEALGIEIVRNINARRRMRGQAEI